MEHIPDVPAFAYAKPHRQPDDPLNIVMWCDFCRVWHFHGYGSADADQPGAWGHRIAHCIVPDSPYRLTGYILLNCGPIPHQLLRRDGYIKKKPIYVNAALDAWLASQAAQNQEL